MLPFASGDGMVCRRAVGSMNLMSVGGVKTESLNLPGSHFIVNP